MQKYSDAMTPDEIKAEVGEILIRGYLRYRLGILPSEDRGEACIAHQASLAPAQSQPDALSQVCKPQKRLAAR
ncbi:hypothetical protein [Sulfidibacter corallicola]|uniref:Uncharacterized protein n=1 Tax=Sulfidibacter corallicola TaxID=2818388 RepID=A0A8A4TIJ3_SULCO|nr:hypothetical protein [Sulfidibacter corallicola]QTD49746.1 hypothetical protein J3U87_29535 [Sulfidibacter corallicola]